MAPLPDRSAGDTVLVRIVFRYGTQFAERDFEQGVSEIGTLLARGAVLSGQSWGRETGVANRPWWDGDPEVREDTGTGGGEVDWQMALNILPNAIYPSVKKEWHRRR